MIDMTLTTREREFLRKMLDGGGSYEWHAVWQHPDCDPGATLKHRGYITVEETDEGMTRKRFVATFTDRGRKVAEATLGGKA